MINKNLKCFLVCWLVNKNTKYFPGIKNNTLPVFLSTLWPGGTELWTCQNNTEQLEKYEVIQKYSFVDVIHKLSVHVWKQDLWPCIFYAQIWLCRSDEPKHGWTLLTSRPILSYIISVFDALHVAANTCLQTHFIKHCPPVTEKKINTNWRKKEPKENTSPYI